MPGIVIMLIMPALLGKFSKRSMAFVGTILMVVGQIAFLFYAGLLFCCFKFDLEKKLPDIRKELVERRGVLEQ